MKLSRQHMGTSYTYTSLAIPLSLLLSRYCSLAIPLSLFLSLFLSRYSSLDVLVCNLEDARKILEDDLTLSL